MLSKRNSVSIIYFVVVIMTLLMRVGSALDMYSALNVDADSFFSCMVQIVIFGVIPVGLYTIFAVKRKDSAKEVLDDFGVKKVSPRNWLRVIILGISMIILATGVSYVWQIFLSMIGYTRIPSPTDYTDVGVLFKELALVALLPGIFEEITHRGLLWAGYRDNKWKFVIISALLFSLMHQNINQTLYTFVDGIIMALAMYYTRSIWCGIFMHMLNNGVSVMLGYIDQHPGVFNWVNVMQDWLYSTIPGMIVSVIAVLVAITLIIILFIRMRKDAVRDGYVDEVPFVRVGEDQAKPLWKDIPFIITVLTGIAATVFSLVWGLLR